MIKCVYSPLPTNPRTHNTISVRQPRGIWFWLENCLQSENHHSINNGLVNIVMRWSHAVFKMYNVDDSNIDELVEFILDVVR